MPGFLRKIIFNLLKMCKYFTDRKVISLQVQTPNTINKYKISKIQAFFSASLTLEASIVVTLFLFSSAALIYPTYLVGMQGQIQAAMEEAGEELVLAAGLSDHEITKILSHIYVKNRVIEILGKDKLDSSFLYNGSQGISFLESSFLRNSDDIDIVVRYEVQIPVPLLNLRRIPIAQRAKKRAWTGRNMKEVSDEKREMVYITTYGTVYHISLSCKHLNTKIFNVDYAALEKLRNENGGIYYPCEFCKPKSGGREYFLTRYGNRYHDKFTCRGLQVTIRSVPLSEAGLPSCKDCGGKGSG